MSGLNYRNFLLFLLPATCSGFGIGSSLAVAGATSFLGWAFNPVGPDAEAAESVRVDPPLQVPELNGLLFTSTKCSVEECQPTVALYCGAKIRPESYALLAREIITQQKQQHEAMSRTPTSNGNNDSVGGVLVLQSPFNIYAFKPATVEKVLDVFPSIRCVTGHSIGGLWAAEYCRDYFESRNVDMVPQLDFVYLGVHGTTLSLAPFRDLLFRNVGYTYATRDGTLQRALVKNDESVDEFVARVRKDELPKSAKVFKVDGGNHSQYGSYGMPGCKQGLAYEDMEAVVGGKEQRQILAKAIVETMMDKESDEVNQLPWMSFKRIDFAFPKF